MQIAKPVFPFTNIPKIRRTTARERAEKFKEHNFNPTLIFLHSLQVLRFIFIANKFYEFIIKLAHHDAMNYIKQKMIQLQN